MAQSGDQYRHGDRRHDQEELDEIPFRDGGDQQVLRFANQGADAAESGADGAVHQQAAQKGAKLLKIFAVQIGTPSSIE